MGRARSTCPELSLRGRRSPLAPALHPQAAGRLAADGVPWLASLLPILTLTLFEERTEGGKAQSAGWVAPPLPQGQEAGRAAASATLKRGGGEGGSAPARRRRKNIFS